MPPKFKPLPGSSSDSEKSKLKSKFTKQRLRKTSSTPDLPKTTRGKTTSHNYQFPGKTQHHSAEKMEITRGVAFLLVVVCTLYLVNWLQTRSQGLFFAVVLPMLDIFAITVVLSIINAFIPMIGNFHWILPTDDGFDLEPVTFMDLMEAFCMTLGLMCFAAGLLMKYDKDMVMQWLGEDDPAEREPCPLRIGAFNSAEDGQFLSDFDQLSPRRPRTASETAFYNLESGLAKKSTGKAKEPRVSTGTNNGATKPSNPAYPLLEDFAGAGYPDVIARNKKMLEGGKGMANDNKMAKEDPDEARIRAAFPQFSAVVSPTRNPAILQ